MNTRLLIGIALCAVLFVFVGCPDGNDPGGGGATTDDTTRPIVTLTGAATIEVEVGTDFTDPGATATDNDPDYGDNIMATPTITNSDGNTILTIDTSTVGATYIITYNAPNDAAGNEAVAVTRAVTVVDTTRPIVTLMGATTIFLELGADFTDPGATATDNDPDYGEKMATATITNSDGNTILTIDTSTVGATYIITYNAPNDAAGNEAVAVTRAVRVGVVIDRDNDRLVDINTLDDLNAIRYNLHGTSYRTSTGGTNMLCGTDATTTCIGYELLRDLDFADGNSYASGMVNDAWRPNNTNPDLTSNAGWEPIGSCNTNVSRSDDFFRTCGDSDDTPFTARFEGRGFTISNLYARNVETDGAAVGLFGTASGSITGIGVVDANIYGGGGHDSVGGLVGRNSGTITASYATGDADGRPNNDFVGGLVGQNFGGTITASYATTDVTGHASFDSVGGLVGRNSGTITASYATGDANGSGNRSDSVGGLVGFNATGGTITASYATGDADGGTDVNDFVGGLVGQNHAGGTITASYGFGTQTGGETDGITRSDDATDSSSDTPPGTVDDACDITVANSSTMTTTPDNRWDTAQWDFGTGTTERPLVRHNNALVPGQPTATAERGC